MLFGIARHISCLRMHAMYLVPLLVHDGSQRTNVELRRQVESTGATTPLAVSPHATLHSSPYKTRLYILLASVAECMERKEN